MESPSGEPERVRWSVELGPEGDDPNAPTVEELRALLQQLRSDLDAALGPSARSAAGDRPLEELIETYRPRQGELVELLLAEGEISPGEAERLRGHLARAPAEPPGAPVASLPAVPAVDRPLAALPLENDRTPASPRPTADLLATYRIESLKQAGAVRARRQISYEEYMALKRHFAAADAQAAARARAVPPAGPAAVDTSDPGRPP